MLSALLLYCHAKCCCVEYHYANGHGAILTSVLALPYLKYNQVIHYIGLPKWELARLTAELISPYQGSSRVLPLFAQVLFSLLTQLISY
jgi:hypothetical protein